MHGADASATGVPGGVCVVHTVAVAAASRTVHGVLPDSLNPAAEGGRGQGGARARRSGAPDARAFEWHQLFISREC